MTMLNPAGELVHFSFPVRRGDDGKVVCDVQDTLANVTSQVNTVIRYPSGYRPEKPSFGIPWPFGQPVPVDGAAITAAVAQQVPGAAFDWTEYATLTADSRTLEIDVEA